ncbi:syntabulin isoform X5 [Gallus gallus]|uniref:syntabulin isoform X5 n=1 Tax=Gallus gallus TaxID=9031 RepID=UPI000D63EF4D|nr:syntabulin isoform X5 [Gallus gallus]XP_040520065.1 syntabulin isoform X5 [Gallus gallus]|eukprot:XP_025003905.1 syntabulin isoform X4 [Gallus gallus]
MGPLRESGKEEQKAHPEKEVSRSRIPRLVLRPQPPQQHKVSPASESPFSEEESREFNPPSSSGGSARTISSNSFCSDDTGCPSSQSVSPVKTPSDAGHSPISFCTGSDGDFSRKKFNAGTMSEGNSQLARYKKETKTILVKPGSEADFSSSSSTGSISAPEVHMSAPGSKRSSFSRKRSGRYLTCVDHHSAKPQNPEQYLTPLQQKEVTVRHLKTKLKESQSKLKERETEIEELKTQLGRMREDWIEEECHRVEAQLALKEAKKEIKQLKQVIETMKNNLAEKDKGIQKYFIDINIQNKKLESLLHSMEMAQNGSLRDEDVSDAPGKPLALYAKLPDTLITEEQALEVDSGVLLNEDIANGNDSFQETFTTAGVELADPAFFISAVDQEVLENVPDEKLRSSRKEERSDIVMVEQSVQTDVVPYSLNVERLIQNIFGSQDVSPLSPPSSLKELSDFSSGSFSDSAIVVDLTPSDPNSAILLSPMESPCRKVDYGVDENRVMKELDFTEMRDEVFGYVNNSSETGVMQRHWSGSLLVDLLAVAAPVVPTVMWVFSTQRGGVDPIYNIGALLRGCCLVALHSLRRTPFNIRT